METESSGLQIQILEPDLQWARLDNPAMFSPWIYLASKSPQYSQNDHCCHGKIIETYCRPYEEMVASLGYGDIDENEKLIDFGEEESCEENRPT